MDGPAVQYSVMILCSGRKIDTKRQNTSGRKCFSNLKAHIKSHQDLPHMETIFEIYSIPKACWLCFQDNWHLLFNIRSLWTPTRGRIQDTWDVCFMKWLSLSFLQGAQEKPQNIFPTTHLHCVAAVLSQPGSKKWGSYEKEIRIFCKWNCYGNQNMAKEVWRNCDLLVFCIGSSCLLRWKCGNWIL